MAPPRVKVCGVTRPEDAALAAALGAAAVGLVFWAPSPRAVTLARARQIVAAVPPLTGTVGVFVDQPVDEVAETASALGLTAVQLHGHEPVEAVEQLACRVIKGLTVEEYEAGAWPAVPSDRVTILLDTADAARRGGTGRVGDWRAAARVAETRRVILAGGLDADNVRQAIRAVQPYAVDVASGVERAPGVKDHGRLRAFMDAVIGVSA